MLKTIIEILENNALVDEYFINQRQTISKELFFIKEKLSMNRGKDVTYYTVTVYRNFEMDGKKYKGSSRIVIDPTMEENDVIMKIDNAALSALSVKNEFYELVKPTNEEAGVIPSAFSDGNTIKHITNLVKDMYEVEKEFSDVSINSCEFFIDQVNVNLINSNGLDVKLQRFNGTIELVTEAKSDTEDVELYTMLNFSDYDKEWMKNTVRDTLENTLLRTKATPLPKVGNIPVILSGDSVKEMMTYFSAKVSNELVYNHMSNSKIGDILQNEDIEGDLVTLNLQPIIKNSARNTYYDNDGVLLKDHLLIDNGKIVKMYATNRFAQYLNSEITGYSSSISVKPGTKSINDFRDGEYLECISFSDFQMEPLSGNFGGEIRLAIYHKDGVKTPVTLASLSGNAANIINEMYLSKESQNLNGFTGPKYMMFKNTNIAGN